MTSTRRRPGRATTGPRLGPVTALAVGLLLLGGCGGDPADPETRPLPSSPVTTQAGAANCASVIEPATITALGWDAAVSPEGDRTSCEYVSDSGNVTVYARPDDFATSCATVEGTAPPGIFERQVTDAGSDQVCGYVNTEQLGGSEWDVDVDGEVVSISIVTFEPTDPATVRDALVSLVSTADQLDVLGS